MYENYDAYLENLELAISLNEIDEDDSLMKIYKKLLGEKDLSEAEFGELAEFDEEFRTRQIIENAVHKND